MKLGGTFSFLALFLLLVGCGQPKIEDTFKQAPQSQEDLGLLVSGLKTDQLQELINQKPSLQFRKISDLLKTYEIKGLTKEEILEVAPKTRIEENRFIKSQRFSYPHKKISFKSIKFSSTKSSLYSIFSPENCVHDDKLETPSISAVKTAGFFSQDHASVGEEFLFTTDESGEQSLSAWAVLAPQGSKILPDLTDAEKFNIKPDMPGLYEVLLFYKEENNCNYGKVEIYVTFNEAHKSEETVYDQKSFEILEKETFSHIEESNAQHVEESLSSNSKEVVVAVIDTGVNYNHPCLKGKMWNNQDEIPGDGIDNDNNGYIDDTLGYDMVFDDAMPMDDDGHGSHVAGLLAGAYVGVADKANIKIMALKTGGGFGIDMGSYIKSLEYALENGADIINLSLGSVKKSHNEEALLKIARERGVLVVAASGNGDESGSRVNNDVIPNYPSSYKLDNILAVAAVDASGRLTSYSNYGKENVDIAAPGGFVEFQYEHLNGRYERTMVAHPLKSAYIRNPEGKLLNPNIGTSMAAPIVSGTVAMMKMQNDKLLPHELISVIKTYSKREPYLRTKVSSGGYLDVAAALAGAKARNAVLF